MLAPTNPPPSFHRLPQMILFSTGTARTTILCVRYQLLPNLPLLKFGYQMYFADSSDPRDFGTRYLQGPGAVRVAVHDILFIRFQKNFQLLRKLLNVKSCIDSLVIPSGNEKGTINRTS